MADEVVCEKGRHVNCLHDKARARKPKAPDKARPGR
jgi:hypothetical protein